MKPMRIYDVVITYENGNLQSFNVDAKTSTNAIKLALSFFVKQKRYKNTIVDSVYIRETI